MVVQLEDGSYLHTAYAISNVASELLPDEWSTTEQGEGMDYVGQYVDDSPLDSDDATDYEWEALYDLDVDDTDEDDVMPVADEQTQLGAIEEQLNILQQDSEELFSALDEQSTNIQQTSDTSSSAYDIAHATGQHFWTDDDGVHISNEEGNPEGERNTLWNSLGMLFRKASNYLLAILVGGADGTGEKGLAVYDGTGNVDENIVAKFTDRGSQIGKTQESHLEMNYHSMKMVDSDGETYLHISDLRNEDGYIVQTETGDGTTYIFATLLKVNEVISVTVDGVVVSATASDNTVTLASTPSDGAEVVITYVPFPENLAKAYTLGQRVADSPIGAMSVAEGFENVASGSLSHVEGGYNVVDNESPYAHAEGRGNIIVSSPRGHAEGVDNRVEGNNAHAEGMTNQALAEASHVEGVGNIADVWGQHVVGRYNQTDNNAVEIVGNGATSSVRSNARTLTFGGKEWLADTLEVSRNPTSPMEVATKDYVDNSGGGGGGTSNYDALSNRPQINGVTLTGNKTSSDLSLVPSLRTVNGKALSSDITLDASDVGALPDTTSIPTKVSDLTNDSDFIPKDDLFFKSGDVYSVTYNHARALTGYVSSSTSGIYFEIPLPKFLTDVTGATITAMHGGVRGISGYVDGLQNNSNLKSSNYRVTASVDNPNTLYVSVVKINSQGSATALSNVTNNTPVSVALNSISITFS